MNNIIVLRLTTGLRRILKVGYFALLLSIAVWSLPVLQRTSGETSMGQKLINFSGPFFRWSGLWQGWSMFAANPSNENLSVQIAIEFYDGTFEFHTLPMLYTMDHWQAYLHERHRKFADNFRRDENSIAWPQLASYYRRLYQARKPVKRIDLVRWWTITPPANFDSPPPQPPEYMNFENSYIFYSAKYPKP